MDHCCSMRAMCFECDPRACPVERAGKVCGNMRFQRRSYPKFEALLAAGRGFGLFAAEVIKPGQFVVEYVGEVITKDECRKRLDTYHEDTPVYMMDLDGEKVIDAASYGNMARFCNHSCDPNCNVTKWNVGAEPRVGFYAKKEIAIGEEITVDYAMQTFGKLQKCSCGSMNCRGALKKPPQVLEKKVSVADCRAPPQVLEKKVSVADCRAPPQVLEKKVSVAG
jgi:hypothetical protein